MQQLPTDMSDFVYRFISFMLFIYYYLNQRKRAGC